MHQVIEREPLLFRALGLNDMFSCVIGVGVDDETFRGISQACLCWKSRANHGSVPSVHN